LRNALVACEAAAPDGVESTRGSRFRTFDKKHGRTAERHQRRHRRERARSCRVESTKDGTLLYYVGTRRTCPSAPKPLSNCNIEPRLWKITLSAELGSSKFRERHAVLAFVRRRRYLSCNGASPIIFQVWTAAAPCSAAWPTSNLVQQTSTRTHGAASAFLVRIYIGARRLKRAVRSNADG
jgi:hypothetical protein